MATGADNANSTLCPAFASRTCWPAGPVLGDSWVGLILDERSARLLQALGTTEHKRAELDLANRVCDLPERKERH